MRYHIWDLTGDPNLENYPQNKYFGLKVPISLGLQVAQSRYYLQTLDPKVGTICILEALGYRNPRKGKVHTAYAHGALQATM